MLSVTPATQNNVEFPIDQVNCGFPVNQAAIWPCTELLVAEMIVSAFPEPLRLHDAGLLFGPMRIQQLVITDAALTRGVATSVISPRAAGKSQVLC